MAIAPIAANGVQGLNRALEQTQRASERIARASVAPEDSTEDVQANAGTANTPVQAPPREDLVQPLVELREAELNARANARSIEAENQVIGSLLDIRA